MLYNLIIVLALHGHALAQITVTEPGKATCQAAMHSVDAAVTKELGPVQYRSACVLADQA